MLHRASTALSGSRSFARLPFTRSYFIYLLLLRLLCVRKPPTEWQLKRVAVLRITSLTFVKQRRWNSVHPDPSRNDQKALALWRSPKFSAISLLARHIFTDG